MPRRISLLIVASLILAWCAPIDCASADDITVSMDEMWGRLKRCWQPPKLPLGHPGMQITARFSFKPNGEAENYL